MPDVKASRSGDWHVKARKDYHKVFRFLVEYSEAPSPSL